MAKVQVVQTLAIRDDRGGTLINYLPAENKVRFASRLFGADELDDIVEAVKAAQALLRERAGAPTPTPAAPGRRGGGGGAGATEGA
jgi:hypothetical protein